MRKRKCALVPGLIVTWIVFSEASVASAAFEAQPCGLVGSVPERIADCNHAVGEGREYQLVTRTQRGQEIYMGRRTGVIWSADIDDAPKNFLDDQVDTICSRDRPEFGGIRGKWILPPIHRYIQGFRYGIQGALPGLNSRTYWSSTPDPFYVDSRYVMEGFKRYVSRNGSYEFRHFEVEAGRSFVKCIIEPSI